jgi:hypothetical protein
VQTIIIGTATIQNFQEEEDLGSAFGQNRTVSRTTPGRAPIPFEMKGTT